MAVGHEPIGGEELVKKSIFWFEAAGFEAAPDVKTDGYLPVACRASRRGAVGRRGCGVSLQRREQHRFCSGRTGKFHDAVAYAVLQTGSR